MINWNYALSSFKFLTLSVRTVSVWFHPVKASSFVWNWSLLFCPFHKELIIWENTSLDIYKRYKQELRLFMNFILMYSLNREYLPLDIESFCYMPHIIMTETSHVNTSPRYHKHRRNTLEGGVLLEGCCKSQYMKEKGEVTNQHICIPKRD